MRSADKVSLPIWLYNVIIIFVKNKRDAHIAPAGIQDLQDIFQASSCLQLWKTTMEVKLLSPVYSLILFSKVTRLIIVAIKEPL